MRFYGFEANELTTPAVPNLALEFDPKLSWALRNRDRFPVDVNAATREELLRIPGVGVRSVKRMLAARRWRRLRFDDLKRLQVAMTRARPFILTDDYSPGRLGPDSSQLVQRVHAANQLDLWSSSATAAHNGEL